MGVLMTSVQSFQEPGLRGSNPSFLSLLPLPVNQTPPRPESARSWSHIPATCHTSGHLSWVLGLGKWPDPGSRARKKAGSWFLHLPDHLPLISSLQTLSKGQAPTTFRSAHSSPMRKGRMVTETQELWRSLGGGGLLGPIFASPSLSSEPTRYRKGSSLTDPAPQLCVC